MSFVTLKGHIQQYIETMKTSTPYTYYIHNAWSEMTLGRPGKHSMSGNKYYIN